jgi:hypothetical protein
VYLLGDALIIAASKRFAAATSSNTGKICSSWLSDLHSILSVSPCASFLTVKHSPSNFKISFWVSLLSVFFNTKSNVCSKPDAKLLNARSEIKCMPY